MISMMLIVFLVFGGLAYFSLSLDLYPNVDIPYVTIQTVYAGAGPNEIETQITEKVEDAVATISNIDVMTSYSMDSVSVIIIKFKIGKDVDVATQEVKDKVDAIFNDLPTDADAPTVEKMDLQAKPVVEVVLSGKMSAVDLFDIADKQLKDRFSQIQGVAKVDLVGGQEREIRVELDNRVVFENAISLPQLSQILKIQNMDMPGGQFQQSSQEYSVRFKGELQSLEDLKELEVPTAFGMKRLGQLAHIRDTSKEVRERTIFFDNVTKRKQDNVVLMSIIKSSDGNTVDMARKIKEQLPEIEKELPAGCAITIVTDKSLFIESSVEDTLGNIFLGVILTSLVLLFFLHDFRSTVIVALSMPFSIIATFLLIQVSDFSLNMMTLMGLSTSVGILVANSVVVLENIFRHKGLGKGRKDAASKGTSEMTVAVLGSTMTNIVVFLPIASMGSLVGQFFKEFALTVTYATVFSLIVSFTLTPMLASLILPETDTKKHRIGYALEKIFLGLENAYRKLLNLFLVKRWRSFAVIAIALLMFFLSFYSAARIPFEFMPALDEGDIQIQVELPQGYHLGESGKLISLVEDIVQKNPEVKHILTQLGTISETDTGVNLANVMVKLVDAEERSITSEESASRMVRQLSNIPNAHIRIAALSSAGGGGAPVSFFLKGQDNEKLEILKNDLVKGIKTIPGLVNLNTSSRSGKPEITLNPDRRKLSEAGLTIYDLAMALRSAVAGIEATTYKDKGEEYDIRVVLNEESVDSPEKIGNITVVSQTGVYRLSQLANIEFAQGYSKILHKDKTKSIQFTAYTGPGFALGTIVEKVRQHIDKINLPGGYSVQWGGDAEMMEESAQEMTQTFIIAFLLTYMLLAAVLESLTQPLMILGTVPLAMIGVFLSLDMTGKTLNIMSMMAIIMLLGIVVNNAILLLDYTNQLRKQGRTVVEALLEACPIKLKPILMSTIAIILGMMPMAIGLGSAGKEFRQPLGIVSIGGLLVSSLLTLFVIPAIYNLTSFRNKKKNPPINKAAVTTAVLLALVIGLGTQVHAESYDLNTFVQMVQKNSKDIKLAKKELDLADVYKKEALATALPKIKVDVDYKRNLKDNFLFIDFPDMETGEMTNQKFKINYKNDYGLTAVVNQTLFSFKVGAALKASKQYQKLTGHVFDAQERAIVTAAKQAFYQTLLLKKIWQVNQSARQNAHDNFLQLKKQFEHGQISEFKLLQAEARWQATLPQVTQVERNYRMSINTLKNLAGIADDQTLELSGDFQHVPQLPQMENLDLVLKKRPDFNAMLWEEKLRLTNVKSERANLYPSLSMNLIYAFGSQSDKFKFERQNHSYIIGLNLSIPVFTGGYNRAQVQKAQIEADKTRIQIDKEKETIYNDIRNTHLRLGEANQRMQSAQKAMETAKKAFEIAQVSANSGLATQLELKDTRLVFDQARLNTYMAAFDYLQAYFNWQLVIGNK
jgi:hydrophobic/amphiphilic exporter-1 (mainly G- bacteria), HAE1 family